MVQNESRHAAPKTDLAKVVATLTMRTADRGMPVPQGELILQVKTNNSGEYNTHSVAWKYFPEKIPSFGFPLRSHWFPVYKK